MTKQLLQGLYLASVVVVLAVSSLPVEAADINCRVPFSFTVNGRTLPPGTYTVSTSQSILSVLGVSGGAFAMTQTLESEDSGAKLVFHKYGEEYILREAWTGGGAGRQLPRPRQEREMAEASRSGKVAVGFERIVVPVL